jgi:hypothetical protein
MTGVIQRVIQTKTQRVIDLKNLTYTVGDAPILPFPHLATSEPALLYNTTA